jgi:diacylglycerol kinase family enzyme
MSIPTFVNARISLSGAARSALECNADFVIRVIAPEALPGLLRAEAERGTRRVLVVGGDGTMSAAAAALAHTGTEVALLPAGTLNHFARDYGIPTSHDDALALARTGAARPVDVGRVNDHSFINTSSVGAYVRFVRARERLERFLGYRLASVVGALQVLFRVRRFRVSIEAGGQLRAYETPLVFVGVGERSLGLPRAGARVHPGRSGLHVLVPRPGTRIRIAGRYALAARGTTVGAGITARLAEEMFGDWCTIELRRSSGWVAVDGELALLQAPLRYRLERGALRVVMPADGAGDASLSLLEVPLHPAEQVDGIASEGGDRAVVQLADGPEARVVPALASLPLRNDRARAVEHAEMGAELAPRPRAPSEDRGPPGTGRRPGP